MTSIDGQVTVETATASDAPASRAWDRFETILERAGERLNPILIKEARQALKSRQFTITFMLLLGLGWLWSIGGMAMLGPTAYYSTGGPFMFFGYYLILAFPLIVIVPYTAFRSLATEREDRTYELLSITTLSARQVISGKLAGAILQMIVYMSAISPCLAFTYLLRGIDVPTMAFMVGYTFLYSLGLSLIGLLLASGTNEKWRQVVLSVAMILGFVGAFWMACLIASEFLSQVQLPIDDWRFWAGNAAFMTGYVSTFLLIMWAATAVLNFASSNRSSRLRGAMLAQHVLFSGWMAWVWIVEGFDYELILVYLTIELCYWFFMGAMMTGESDRLSPRVKRDLPQSFLGRAVLTWFNPGPAAGYMFAVGSFVSAAAFGVGAAIYHGGSILSPTPRAITGEKALEFAVVALCYLTIYLGLGKLILALARRFGQGSVTLAFLVQLMLLVMGVAGPWMIQMSLLEYRQNGWTMMQITNPFWTLSSVYTSYWLANSFVPLAVLIPSAIVVLFLNLPAVANEVRNVRIVAPARVVEEDAQIAAETALATPQPTSPWD